VHLSRQAFQTLFVGGEMPPPPLQEPDRPAVADLRAFLAERGVVLEPAALAALDLLWAESRHGSHVLVDWGFGITGAARSIVGLFHGPSGTGKTLTARTLADALGRELLVVNYAELLNLYIGETEKNVVKVFAEARKKNAVLLFDEADALVGRRGEIVRAGDRLINGEVNTALMELERHEGVVILTTNHAGLLDQALERRIRHKVLFAAPGSEARARIWRARIPAQAPLAEDVDFETLGREFELTGGQIANATLIAAFSAAARSSDGGAAITMADLRSSARQELAGYGTHKTGPVGF
jgi:SpoVK/Ycf46/Vps4 family AAA+-type ATPase